jgi:hypothetical protein
VFPKALGGALGVLPAILGLWGGFLAFMHDLDRRGDVERARYEAQHGLGSRVTALEGRLLDFEEARRQRSG